MNKRVVLTFNDAREAARFVQEVRDLCEIMYQDGTSTFSDVYVAEYGDSTQWEPPHGAYTRKVGHNDGTPDGKASS